MKKTFYSELAYLLGLAVLALGTALMERADFGMSMVVAPAYLLHRKLAPTLPFFTFGVAEYCLQLMLIVGLTAALRRWKKGYLFSFVTAVVYGLLLDGWMALVRPLPMPGVAFRCGFFLAGMVLGSVGVALLFHTYFAPEAYELVVKELAAQRGASIAKVKTAYDLVSLAASVGLSFLFFGFGHFEGVKLGTLITALVNGWLIGRLSAGMEQRFAFRDALPLRGFFEGEIEGGTEN